MEQQFIQQLKQWHDEDKHQLIVDTITALPPEQQDYQLIGILARALNNLDRYEEALTLLLSVKEEGDEDPLWHYRVGYSYFYMDCFAQAETEFTRAQELNPEDEDAVEFLLWCKAELEKREPMYCPQVYLPEELAAVEQHILRYFGDYPSVFHELVSPDIHVDICVIPPTSQRNYYTLVTTGMGAHRMNVPESLRENKLDRAEMVICLPPDWDLQGKSEESYWPLRWLKILSRLPGEEDSWLGWGHTVPNGGPFADNTQLSGVLLVNPGAFGPAAEVCVLPNGDEVNFYQVIPLYEEEMEYKIHNGVEALLELMPDRMMEVVNIHRENVCNPGDFKFQRLSPEEIKPLLTEWQGPDGCIASDRIVVDGCQVGYLYRESPNPAFADSGWRMTAGDEPEGYLNDPQNSGAYSLNILCNYDPDIVPLLTSPVGTAYIRDKDGVFQLEEFVNQVDNAPGKLVK